MCGFGNLNSCESIKVKIKCNRNIFTDNGEQQTSRYLKGKEMSSFALKDDPLKNLE